MPRFDSSYAPKRRHVGKITAWCALVMLAHPLIGHAFNKDGITASEPVAVMTVHPNKWPKAHSVGVSTPVIEKSITALLQQMTVEEKVGQIIQTDISNIAPEELRRYPLGSLLAGGDSGPYGNERASAKDWLAMVREFRAISMESRPHHVPIPIIFGIDAVHGHNNLVGATLFPHNVGLGAMRDPALVKKIARATAEEVSVTGMEWAFAPTLANARDARWGRAYESFSQDPTIIAQYAKAYIEGLQGEPLLLDTIQQAAIAGTAKHFLGDGGTHYGEDQGDDLASEDELIKLHAAGYQSAIDAGVLTVMASYSSWHGQKMHGYKALLTDVLKGQMGFEGLVVGDYNGHAQLPGCVREHCPQAINAGVDLFMAPWGWRALFDQTVHDVQSGVIPLERLNDAVRRNLRVKFRLGLIDGPRPMEGQFQLINSPAHRAIARQAVRESLVLLKNNHVLPIKAHAKVYITGPSVSVPQTDMTPQAGGWTISWQGSDTTKADFPNAESIGSALRQAIVDAGGQVIGNLDSATSVKPDLAVVIFGEQPYAEMHGDIKFPIYNAHDPLATMQLLQKQGIPVVAIFLTGRPLWVNSEINAADAFVVAWLPGSEGGGVADVLVADIQNKPRFDFTGKLPFDWPATPFAEPYSTIRVKPQFPFGFGLTYSSNILTPVLRESFTVDIH
jgi:beta-glucosidase